MRVRVTWPGGGQNDYELSEYQALASTGIIPNGSPVHFMPSADDVRTEASRRMQALVGARDAEHLAIIVANGSREAIRLLRIKTERAWTPEEAARAAQLEASDAAFEAIRAASNRMEADPPADFAGHEHWP